ncbi:MAG: hypothetical protein HY695_04495 [Deltaproteobacteria bacterium]|nr:hypothetical protein [Deltaproteobacteria bacterium]
MPDFITTLHPAEPPVVGLGQQPWIDLCGAAAGEDTRNFAPMGLAAKVGPMS